MDPFNSPVYPSGKAREWEVESSYSGASVILWMTTAIKEKRISRFSALEKPNDCPNRPIHSERVSTSMDCLRGIVSRTYPQNITGPSEISNLPSNNPLHIEVGVFECLMNSLITIL